MTTTWRRNVNTGQIDALWLAAIYEEIIPSKLEVAQHALKMSEWVSGVEWMDTP